MQDAVSNMLNTIVSSMLHSSSFWLMMAIFVVVSVLKTPWFKGKFGEWFVARILNNRLDPACYRVVHNVMIPDQAGGTTQIDHVVFSAFGVFVIETKNMKGWIFGDANSAMWTQTIYRSKHKFQNPFRQNYKHIKCLAELTGLDERHLIHVIVFIGNCSMKTRESLPEALVTNGRELIDFIRRHQTPVISPDVLQAAMSRLDGGRIGNTYSNTRSHVAHVREIVEEKDGYRAASPAIPVPASTPTPPPVEASPVNVADTPPACPQCAAPMVLRTAAKGANAGNRFWGCSKYPQCRGIRNEP
ncbi:MAG: nuclease [Lentisphaerae bacterium]|jgi:hypothetical protein|nr:nuclease [Lentisphaerota bacterium]